MPSPDPNSEARLFETHFPLVDVLLVGLVLRLWCKVDLIASDDLRYSCVAARIAKGTFVLEVHDDVLRYGVTVPATDRLPPRDAH